MDKIVRGMSQAGRRAGEGQPKARTSARPDDARDDPHAKGTMREPAQTPDGERGSIKETQEAFEEFEKEKGDWSKGG